MAFREGPARSMPGAGDSVAVGREGTIAPVTSDDLSPLPDDDQVVVSVPDQPADPEALAAAAAAMRLVELVREIEKHVSDLGWDQNPRIFALARTSELLAFEPGLASAIGEAAQDPTSLTPIEQDHLDHSRPLDEVLATTAWPEEVHGAALVLERVMLPPSAEDALPDDQAELADAVAVHPERQDVRMAVVVTREGGRMCALRLRSHDTDDQVLVGEQLVPRLADALLATFR